MFILCSIAGLVIIQIHFQVEQNGKFVEKEARDSNLTDFLLRFDSKNIFYGLYAQDELIELPCNGMVLKKYKTWFKFNKGNPVELPCSPYETVHDFLQRLDMCDHLVMQQSGVILPGLLKTSPIASYVISKDDPLWMRNTLVVPVNCNGSQQLCDIEATEDISDYVRGNFMFCF